MDQFYNSSVKLNEARRHMPCHFKEFWKIDLYETANFELLVIDGFKTGERAL